MKAAWALFVLAAALPAQIDSLSAPASANRVFFTTFLRPADADSSVWRKAYTIENGQVSLLAQGEGQSWRVDGVSSSADGSVLGINRSNPCNFGTGCVRVLQEFSEIRTSQWTKFFDGHAQISANGAFALLTRKTGFDVVPTPDILEKQLQRLDLSASEPSPEPLGARPAERGRWIADDGTVLLDPVQGAGWTLQSVDGDPVRIGYPSVGSRAAFLLADGSAVVYQAADRTASPIGSPFGELRVRYRDGTEASLGAFGELVDVTPNGLVLYTAQDIEGVRQAFVLQLQGGAIRQATELERGVELAAVAANGAAVIVVSAGRLLRVDLTDGHVELLLGPLPFIDRGALSGFADFKPVREPHVPGSTYRIGGERLAAKTTLAPQPAGTDLDGIQVEIDGAPAAVLWTSAFEIGYQVDWATPTAEDAQVVVRHEASGWEAPLQIRELADVWPRSALPDDEGFTLAVHQDFDRLVTAADPARPGEYIHLYATGLGPTDPPVATGHAAPAGPPATITTPCVWTAFDRGLERPAEVVFAGLAPGLTGFYQVVVRVFEDAQGEFFALRCDPYGGFGRIHLGP